MGPKTRQESKKLTVKRMASVLAVVLFGIALSELLQFPSWFQTGWSTAVGLVAPFLLLAWSFSAFGWNTKEPNWMAQVGLGILLCGSLHLLIRLLLNLEIYRGLPHVAVSGLAVIILIRISMKDVGSLIGVPVVAGIIYATIWFVLFPAMQGGKPSRLAALSGPVVGELAPEIEGVDLEGVEFKLSNYRGKVVMLNFYGDW